MGEIATHLEVEAKFLVAGESELEAIESLDRLGPFPLVAAGRARLHSVYLDTARFALARRGIALRLRRCGRRWEATAKWSGRVAGVIHKRHEESVPLRGAPPSPFRLPPGPLHRRLHPVIRRSILRPILVTAIERRTLFVLDSTQPRRQEPLAELALDQVTLRAPGARRALETYHEVEIEIVHGSRTCLGRLVRHLRRHVRVTPSRLSKFARGMALLHPELTFDEKKRGEVHALRRRDA